MTRDTDMTTTEQAENRDTPTLVAILVAARQTGDRDLERYARDRLADQGIRVAFARRPRPKGGAR